MSFRLKRLTAFALCIVMCFSFSGCNYISEQWDVLEAARGGNNASEEASAEPSAEATTTEEYKVQNVLDDFMNYDSYTLGGRIDTPNGYTRVNYEPTNEDISKQVALEAQANLSGDASIDTYEYSDDEDFDDEFDDEETDSDVVAGSATNDEELSTDANGNLVASSTTEAVSTDNATSVDAATSDETTTEVTTEARTNNAGEVSIETFMRSLPVKAKDSQTMYYTGSPKENQDAKAAILNLPLDGQDLQQFAGSVMRLYGEYFWTNQDYDDLKFTIGNGITLDYSRWKDGDRVTIENNVAQWTTGGETGDTYENFNYYLQYYFVYSSIQTLLASSHEADINDIQVGDYYLDKDGGQPAMVVDVAENAEGDRCFLLASGGSPGQDIEILKNPAHEDPWYYISEINGKDFETPERTMDGSKCYHYTSKDSPSGDAETSEDTTEETTEAED